MPAMMLDSSVLSRGAREASPEKSYLKGAWKRAGDMRYTGTGMWGTPTEGETEQRCNQDDKQRPVTLLPVTLKHKPEFLEQSSRTEQNDSEGDWLLVGLVSSLRTSG